MIRTILVLLALATTARAGETARQRLDRRQLLEDGARHWNDRQQQLAFKIVGRRGGEHTRDLTLAEKR